MNKESKNKVTDNTFEYAKGIYDDYFGDNLIKSRFYFLLKCDNYDYFLRDLCAFLKNKTRRLSEEFRK